MLYPRLRCIFTIHCMVYLGVNGHERKEIAHKHDTMPVILVSYPEATQSLLSDLLEMDSRLFYVQEPLYPMKRVLAQNHEQMNVVFLNGIHELMNRTAFSETYTSIIEGHLLCNFEEIDIDSLYNPFYGHHIKTRVYQHCLKRFDGKFDQMTVIQKCIGILSHFCCSSSRRLVSIDNIDIPMLIPILLAVPNTRILHFIPEEFTIEKDEEASRMDVEDHSKEIGLKIAKNTAVLKEMSDNGQHVLTVTYGQLTSNTAMTVNLIYTFLQLNIDQSLISILHKFN